MQSIHGTYTRPPPSWETPPSLDPQKCSILVTVVHMHGCCQLLQYCHLVGGVLEGAGGGPWTDYLLLLALPP